MRPEHIPNFEPAYSAAVQANYTNYHRCQIVWVEWDKDVQQGRDETVTKELLEHPYSEILEGYFSGSG
ncbi:MAG: hypothetical protein ACC700_10175 [Anaerolineales bacterium]